MFEASNAVDGDKSKLTASVGQCTKSSSHQTATWWVNLTSVHSIHHITIYFRAGKTPWSMITLCILPPITLIMMAFINISISVDDVLEYFCTKHYA